MSAQLLKTLDELDQLLKGQITQGGNSEVREWAGSDHMDQSIPKPAPNGTDYRPTKDIAHKAMADLTNEEIEYFLKSRRTGQPNFRAAELEIERLPGVRKSVCTNCSGYGQDSISKSLCGICGGHGVVFDVLNEQTAQIVKSICDKYNVGKSGSAHTGGASGDADPTPKAMTAFEKKKVDNGGKMVAKGKMNDMKDGGMPEEDDEDPTMPAGMKKGKMGDGMDPIMLDVGKKTGKDDLDEMDETKKSLWALNKGMQTMLHTMKSLVGQVSRHGEFLEQASGGNINKGFSLEDRQPARPPRSISSNIRVAERGWADQAPGGYGNDQYVAKGLGPNASPYVSRYDMITLQKSASAMACAGDLDPMEVVRLDSGSQLNSQVVRTIEGWIDRNGVPQTV